MRIALIQCPQWQRNTPPIALASLRAVLKLEGHQSAVFDLNNSLYLTSLRRYRDRWSMDSVPDWQAPGFVHKYLEENRSIILGEISKIAAFKPHVAAFSVRFSSLLMSLEAAKMIKAAVPGTHVVFGGPECSPGRAGYEAVRDECVDSLIQGEGEKTLPALLAALNDKKKSAPPDGVVWKRNGRLFFGGPGAGIRDIGALPYPDFSVFRLSGYGMPDQLPVASSRGCPRRCSFCNVNSYWHGFSCMTAERLMDEIRYQKREHGGLKRIWFAESILNGNLKELDRFCELMIREKLAGKDSGRILWAGEAAIDRRMDGSLLRKMRLAGCYSLSYGLESGSAKVLKDMKKGFDPETAAKVLELTRKAGIFTACGFIIGFPTENEYEFGETLEFLSRNSANINIADPSETFCSVDRGTELARCPEKYGIRTPAHPIYWETSDGQNTFRVRSGRFRRFCSHAGKLGIRIGGSGRMASGRLKRMLREYERYENGPAA